jgi:hypothetical protein
LDHVLCSWTYSICSGSNFLYIANKADVGLPMMDGVLQQLARKVATAKILIVQAAKQAFQDELVAVANFAPGAAWISPPAALLELLAAATRGCTMSAR